jgi:hypothetical protein
MPHDLYNNFMFNFIKSFFQNPFKENQLLLRFLIEMKIFKRPWQAVLDASVFQKSILVLMYHLQNYILLSICQYFVINLIEEFNNDIGLKSLNVVGLGTHLIEILLDDRPTSFHKFSVDLTFI